MKNIEINPQILFRGSILAAIVHAVTAGEYPELNYEHSWDGINYCMNQSNGCRGVITFHEKYIIAVFRDESKIENITNAMDYFEGADGDIEELAETEALQYMLVNINGKSIPVITAAFFGTWEHLYSNQSLEDCMKYGGYIINNQLMDYQDALKAWDDYYGLNEDQLDLIDKLFQCKVECGIKGQIELSEKDKMCLYGDIRECRESFGELNIKI